MDRCGSLDERIKVLQREKDELVVRSPLNGKVQTWDVAGQLKGRPVRQGQQLVSIFNPQDLWKIEVFVEDRHIGYVQRARSEQSRSLPVRFVVSSDPEAIHVGHLEQIGMSTEIREPHGLLVRVEVSVENPDKVRSYRPGTGVVARIHCGRGPGEQSFFVI